MSDRPEEQRSVWGEFGRRHSTEARGEELRRERREAGRFWRVAVAALIGLYVVGLAAWLSVSPPGKDRPRGRVGGEQLAFETGQLAGTAAGIWGGALACGLLLRSARPGPRVGRRGAGGFAALFGLGAVLTLGGLVLLWAGTNPRDLDNPESLRARAGGAAVVVAGAGFLAYAFTRPLAHPSTK